MNNKAKCLAMLLGMGLLACPAVNASAATDSTVKVIGEATVESRATMIRIVGEISATGDDVPAAMKALDAKRLEIKTAIEALKPTAGTLTISDSVIGSALEQSAQSAEQQYMRRMMMREARPQKPVTTVTASALASATFDVPAGDPEAQLLVCKTLEDKIHALFKAGTPVGGKELSAEEKERIEEMQAMAGASGDGSPSVTIQYVARVTDGQYQDVIRRAIATAKAEAEALAVAAGMKLGTIREISTAPSSEMVRYMSAMAMARGTQETKPGAREVIGTAPGQLKLSVTVDLNFNLVP